MHARHPVAFNVRALLEGEPPLTTGELIAVVHQVCAHPGPTFPSGPEDLWLTGDGELLVDPSPAPSSPAVDARVAIAELLEMMVPAGGRVQTPAVPGDVQGLPALVRAASDAPGQGRTALRAILAPHVGGEAPQVLQELARRLAPRDTHALPLAGMASPALLPEADRLSRPAPAPDSPVARGDAVAVMHHHPPSAVDDDLDLYAGYLHAPPAPASVDAPNRPARRRRVGMAAAVAAAGLIVASGLASYWWVRNGAAENGRSSQRRDTSALDAELQTEVPGALDAAAAPPDIDPPVLAAATATQPPWPLHLDVADGAFSPTFDTSGRELFFHAGRAEVGRLLVASLDERGQVAGVSTLMDEPARNYHPRVSPDGRLLAFDSDRGGQRSVYVSERDGSTPQLVSGNGYGAVPTWSPDMKWLAFVRGEAGRPRVWNLWLRNLSSGALLRHTSYRSGQVWGASWFPDGQSICYSHEHRLVISRLDASEDIAFDTPRPGHLVRTPAVSPDGRRVVFQVSNDGVWLLDVPTREMHRILDDRTAEEFSWTPDGTHIAYHSRRGGAWRIWMLNVPG